MNLIILLVEKVTVIVDQIIRESYCETIILCSKISNVVYGTYDLSRPFKAACYSQFMSCENCKCLLNEPVWAHNDVKSVDIILTISSFFIN